ncbi:MAG TPA: alpha/beta hydrolase [Gaiellaceae bacterium]|nr:alpha/beta hydrolase [Gaiellaceae bacterium]
MPDARVQAAIDNWAPRFVSQGVEFNDFRRTTSTLERWDDWLGAWVGNGELHQGLGEEAEAAGNALTAGEAWVRAALSFHFAKFVWHVDDALNRDATERAKAAIYAAHRCLDPGARRIEIPFEDGTLVGNLRRPAGDDGAALVLLLPGLDSTKEEFFNWEDVFLRRGMATFSFDGPGQGESGFVTHIRPDYEAAVTAALDSLAWDGPVGACGVSLGGYYAPRAAAREPRLAAVAGVSGAFNFGECWEHLPGLTREAFQHHTGAADEDEARAKAFELDLGPVIADLDRPALMVTGKLDRLIPWEQTKRIADEAALGRFVLYEEGNHVCNNIPYKYRPLVADWLAKELRRVG